MLKKKVITNVSNLCFCNNDAVIIGNSKYIGKGIKSESEFGMVPAICLSDKILVQFKQFGKIDIFDIHGNSFGKLDLSLNLYSPFYWNDKLVLVNRKTKTYWSVDKNIKLEDLHFYKHYNFQITNQFYSIENQDSTFFLAQYDFKNVSPNWKIELPGEVFINSGQRPKGDSEKIYIPFEKQLICMCVTSGKELWKVNCSHSFDLDDNILIQNRGDSIVVIDNHTGVELRDIIYCEIPELRNFRSTGPVWIFEKYICVIDTLKGVICLIEKDGLNVFETFNLGYKIPNDRNSIRMKKGKLYLLDSENKLNIIETNLKQA